MELFILCIKIFFARILDVSIGVIRTMELVKNNTIKAVILAFFEVLIWFLIAKEALSSSEFNILIAISYSLGYAIGTLIGSYLSKVLIKGNVKVEVISSIIKNKDINYIKKNNFGVSSLTLDNNKKMLFIELNNNKINRLISLINSIDSNAFISVRDTKSIYNGFIK